MFGETVRKMSNSSLIKDIPPSLDLAITPMKRFLPIHYTQIKNKLWPANPVSFDKWRTLFANSSAIHTNSQLTKNIGVVDDPRYCAYALLGPAFCPLAYYSTREF